MKQKITNLKIRCNVCKVELATVQGLFNSFDNEWDPDEPTGWVKQKIKGLELGVLTHKPIQCTNPNCENFEKDIGVLKLEFTSRIRNKQDGINDNKAELSFT